jgi:fibronectin-binding autotransporter adhesin
LNYSGKIDAKMPIDGLGAYLGGHTHIETVHAAQAPSDAIIIPDAQLLFHGDFNRSGADLILSGADRELVLHDYFKGDKRAALSSPDGAHLTGDLVNALAGHVEYAQADGNAGANQVIGHVTKLVGTAAAIRNGVSIILNNGDNVEKGDVVTSGSDSTLGITFIDGTVFGLSSNARMVLNEMVYDPNGSNNSSLLSLVAGTITFVAGETAKHGDMKVDTPVATMGIRGTAVLVEIDFTVPGQGTPDARFQVLAEPDGTTGSYILFDKTTLTPLAVVNQAGLQINISNGIMSQTLSPLSPEIQQLINDVFSLKFSDSSNTKSLQNFTDTITPQGLSPIQLASGDTATPVVLFTTTPINNSSPFPSPNGPTFIPIPHIDQPPSVAVSGNAALTVHNGTSLSTGFDSVSGTIGFADINAADLPTTSTNFVSLKLLNAQQNDITATLTSQQIAAIEAQLVVTPSAGNHNNGSATWTYNVADTAFSFLTAGETLTLTYDAVVNNNYSPLDQASTVPFTITISAPSFVEWIHPTGGLWSVGSDWSSGAPPTATEDAIIPAQNIPGGSGLYDVTIEAPAFARNLTLNANDTTGAEVTNDSSLTIGEVLTIFNDGVLNNSESGTVSIGQKIELLDESSLQNSGLITLGQGGDFEHSSTVTNSGTIEIAGGTLNVEVDITNLGGIIIVDDGATLTLSGTTINGGTIDDGTASGTGSTVFGSINVTSPSTISDASLNNGVVTIASGVTLTLDNDTVNGTTFTDTASGATIQIDDGTVLTLADATINGGIISDGTASGAGDPALFGGIDIVGASAISDTSLNNGGVTLESGVTLTLDDDTVNGTTFTDTASGATIQIDDGTVLTLTDATINGGTIDDGTAGGTGTPALFGSIDVTGPSTISNAFLNNGDVTIASGVALTLSNDIVTGTTFNDGVGSTADMSALDGSAISGTFAGTIDISGAVTFQSGVAVNAGAMSIAKGATLDIENPVTGIGATLNDVDVMNSGTIQVDSDGPGTRIISLELDGGTTVTGGTLLIHVDFPVPGIEGAVEIGAGGATFDNVTVDNNNILTIDDDVTLKLDDSTVINNGNLAIGTLGVLDVEQGPGTLSEGTPDATLDGVAVADDGTIEIGTAGTGDPTLLLDDATVISNGNLVVGTLGVLDVEQGPAALAAGMPDATLDGVAVSNSGNIDIGMAGTTDPTLLLDDGTVISSGNLTIGTLGELDVEQGLATLSEGTPDATLDGVAVVNNGNIDIGTVGSGDPTLLLDDATMVSNGALTVGSVGTLEIGAGGATLNSVNVVNGNVIEILAGNILTLDGTTIANFGATITVDGTATLALNGATIGGGTINDFSTVLDSIVAGTIDVTGASTLGGLVLNNGAVMVSGVTLTMDNDTVNGTTFTDTDGIIQIDVGTTLNLNGDAIDGGSLSGLGTIATVGGITTFDDVAIANVTTVNVIDDTVLELVGTIADSGMIALNSLGDTTQLEISGNVLLNGGGQVALTDDAHNAIVSDGSAATLTNSNTITGAGTIGDTLLTLVNDGTVDATGTNALTIDTGVNTDTSAGPKGSHWSVGSLAVTNDSAGILEASDGHLLQIDDNVLNNGLIQSGVIGGTSVAVVNVAGDITGTGSIDIFDNAQVEIGGSVSAGQTVTFEVSNGAAELILDDPQGFQGLVKGLVEAHSEASENYIDLKGFSYNNSETEVVSASFNSATDVTAVTITNGNSANNFTIDLVGDYHAGDFEFASDGVGGTLFSDPAANSGAVTVASDTTLDIAAAGTAMVSFANSNGNTGELVLGNAKAFTGQIVGFAGNGTSSNSDLIDLADVNIASVAMNKTTYTENGNGTGTLSLYDANGHALDHITFDGSYQLANFTIENDGSGHTLIVDPPASSGVNVSSSVVPNDARPAANAVVMHDPGPPAPSSTIVAATPMHTLSSLAAGDNFAFNLEGVGHATVTDVHRFSEGLQFGSSTFASVQTLFTTHDDSHGNTVIAVDGHDTITLRDAHQTLLHMGDFHLV